MTFASVHGTGFGKVVTYALRLTGVAHRPQQAKATQARTTISTTKAPTAMAMPTLSLAAAVVLLLLGAAAAASGPPPPCSRSCASLNCDSVGIRYGKFCGVGWSGCEGEEPCDDLDACCRDHDYCVEKKGLMSIKCHEKFKNCMRKVKKAGKVGFSMKCPYELAMATMTQGMDMAIMLSQLGRQKLEL